MVTLYTKPYIRVLSGLWLRYAMLQNLIPSFPRVAPPHPPPWRNPRKGWDQTLPSGNLVFDCTSTCCSSHCRSSSRSLRQSGASGTSPWPRSAPSTTASRASSAPAPATAAASATPRQTRSEP